jgi:hypothetical protein
MSPLLHFVVTKSSSRAKPDCAIACPTSSSLPYSATYQQGQAFTHTNYHVYIFVLKFVLLLTLGRVQMGETRLESSEDMVARFLPCSFRATCTRAKCHSWDFTAVVEAYSTPLHLASWWVPMTSCGMLVYKSKQQD